MNRNINKNVKNDDDNDFQLVEEKINTNSKNVNHDVFDFFKSFYERNNNYFKSNASCKYDLKLSCIIIIIIIIFNF